MTFYEFPIILSILSRRLNAFIAMLRIVLRSSFLGDEKTQDAVVRNFEIIGEAARNIERYHSAFAESHPEVPWVFMYAMRNRIAHGYFKVDFELVWKTIHEDLPELHELVRKLFFSLILTFNAESMNSPHFQFLETEWPMLLEAAVKAEAMANTDARTSCFYARRTLEMAVAWLYKYDPALKLPYQDHLSALIH